MCETGLAGRGGFRGKVDEGGHRLGRRQALLVCALLTVPLRLYMQCYIKFRFYRWPGSVPQLLCPYVL